MLQSIMRAKKSLGQNFLNSKTIAHDIVNGAELSPADTVLEIGPGEGFLTERLIATGAHVIAVEKDDRLIPLLSEKFAQELRSGQFTLIHDDIVELAEQGRLKIPKQYKLVANIPYYITGFLLRTFLETTNKPERMILMVQKEVAERIVAQDGKESILSLAVKAYGVPRIIKKVPARYFTPAPNVDSAVLAITDISGKNFSGKQEEARFFEVVKAGFAHKRKQIAGNLKELFGEKTSALLEEAGVAPSNRAEDVPLAKWLALTKAHLAN